MFMNTDYTVFVVDNDKTDRIILDSMLSNHYNIETFESAENCLTRLNDKWPNLFILDVDLPGMNGFELCREIKGVPEADNIPIVFLSSHDDPSDVLTGYDAGGQDYIFKPYDILSLHHKIENLHRIKQDKDTLAVQAQASDELASLVMANLDEYAVLIKFLRTLNECASPAEVVDAILHVLHASHLEGAVQIRMRNLNKTYSRYGENWPLEVAVLNHVRTLDRIFEFKNHAAYNFERITILLTNMPIENPDLCGRIRDNLCIAAESADAKLLALQSFEDLATVRDEINVMVQGVGITIQSFSNHYADVRLKESDFTVQLIDDLLASFAHLGMSDQQEENILGLVKTRLQELIQIGDISRENQDTLARLNAQLNGILAKTQRMHQATRTP
jgi:DNA-binding response OmpR family regulator